MSEVLLYRVLLREDFGIVWILLSSAIRALFQVLKDKAPLIHPFLVAEKSSRIQSATWW